MSASADWNFHLPTRILFGWDRWREVPALAATMGTQRAFVMVGKSFLAKVGGVSGLQAALQPLAINVFAEIEENPSIATVETAAAACRQADAELMVAIGGGSVIDAAKAVSLLQTNEGSIREYLDAQRKPARRGLPLIAVPTTAGTGSEVTPYAVITNPEKHTKPSIGFPESFPDYAIVDPELTLSMPRPVAVSSGLDAFTQAMEGFWSLRATEMTRAMSFRAIVLLYRNLEAACLTQERTAVEKVAAGSVIGGAQMAICGNTALHPLSYPLTLDYGLRHGAACAIYLPAFLRYNASHLGPWFDDLLAVLGLKSAEQFADDLTAKMERLGAPTRLSALGVPKSAIPNIVAYNAVARAAGFNPRPLTNEDLIVILEGML